MQPHGRSTCWVMRPSRGSLCHSGDEFGEKFRMGEIFILIDDVWLSGREITVVGECAMIELVFLI